MRDALLGQFARQQLRGLHRGRADQRRLAALRALADVLDDRLELVLLRQVHEVRRVVADHRPVRRDHGDFEPVDLLELERLGIRGARHAGELGVHAEEVLERDRGNRLVFLAHVHAFLGLDRLVQAVRPATSRHRATGELVDDDHLAVPDDVLDVAAVERVRPERRVQVVHQPDVGRVVEALAFLQQAGLQEQFLDVLVAFVRQVDLLALLVRPVVALALLGVLRLQARNELVDARIELGAFLGRAGNDQRRARFVDQDRVHLVHDRERERALHAVLEPEREVVTQVIEAEFVVRAVGYVRRVGHALFIGGLAGLDHANGEPEEAEDGTHPLGVAACEVLVHRDDVGAGSGQRVQVGGQRRDQRLALAGPHLGDLAGVQHHAADELHVEVPQAERAPRRLANHRKCLGQQVVQHLARGQLLAELAGLVGKVGVGERLQRGLEGVYLPDDTVVLADEPLVAATKDSGKPIGHWGSRKKNAGKAVNFTSKRPAFSG